MKLQIEAQKLRVRVDEQELARLLAGAPVESHTRFAAAFCMQVTLTLTPQADASLDGQLQAWLIGLPLAAVREHAASLPNREGLHFTLAGARGEPPLELRFDVDGRASARRRRSTRGS